MMETFTKTFVAALATVLSLFNSIDSPKVAAKNTVTEKPKPQIERKVTPALPKQPVMTTVSFKSPAAKGGAFVEVKVPEIKIEMFNPKHPGTSEFWIGPEFDFSWCSDSQGGL